MRDRQVTGSDGMVNQRWIRIGQQSLLSCFLLGAVACLHGGWLTGPDVILTDWGTRGLNAADVDRDGRIDVVVLNNDRAKIEVLFQKDPEEPVSREYPIARRDRWEPVLEDARFRRFWVEGFESMYDLAIGDFDGNGLVDFAVASGEYGLAIIGQQETGEFELGGHFEAFGALPWTGVLAVADLNADGCDDIVQLADERFVVCLGAPVFGDVELVEQPMLDGSPSGLALRDLDGDGLVDAVYTVGLSDRGFRYRAGLGDGRFGPEASLEFDSATDSLAWFAHDGNRQRFAALVGRSRSPALFEVSVEALEECWLAQALQVVEGGVPGAAAVALGDVDGNGFDDLITASALSPALNLFRGGPGGLVAGDVIPVTEDISSIAAGDFRGNGRAAVVMLSPLHELLVLTEAGDDGLLPFPKPIQIEREFFESDATPKPQLVVATDLFEPRDGRAEALLLVNAGDQWFLEPLFPGKDPFNFTAGKPIELPEMSLRRGATGLNTVDLNQDGALDVVVLVRRGEPVVLLQRDGYLEIANDLGRAPGGVLADLTPERAGTGDLDGDGRDEWLIASEGFIRALRIDGSNRWEVVGQINALNPGDRLSLPHAFDLHCRDELAVAAFSNTDAAIKVFVLDEDHERFRFDRSIAVETSGALRQFMLGNRATGARKSLIVGDSCVVSLTVAQTGLAIERLVHRENDLPGVVYNHVIAGDLDADGMCELVLLDGSSNRVELIEKNGDSFSSHSYFRVFDTDRHFQGRQGAPLEPREMLLADVTADGLNDLVFLVHDRVLVYPGRSRPVRSE